MDKDNLRHKSSHGKSTKLVTVPKVSASTESSSKKKKKHLHKKSPELQTKLTSVLKSLELRHSATTLHSEHVHSTKVSIRPQAATESPAVDVPLAKTPTVLEVMGTAADGTRLDHALFPEDAHEQVPSKKSKFVDLFPWPFEKTFKGVIRHRDWNGLVKDIQDAVDCESAHENDHLHEEIAHLLDERDALQAKLNEMREYILKEHREFEAHFN